MLEKWVFYSCRTVTPAWRWWCEYRQISRAPGTDSPGEWVNSRFSERPRLRKPRRRVVEEDTCPPCAFPTLVQAPESTVHAHLCKRTCVIHTHGVTLCVVQQGFGSSRVLLRQWKSWIGTFLLVPSREDCVLDTDALC